MKRVLLVSLGLITMATYAGCLPADSGGTGGTSGQGKGGTTGQAGDNGTAGTTGQAGDNGTAGTTGVAGDNGTAGTTGQAGDNGTAGTTGNGGSTGGTSPTDRGGNGGNGQGQAGRGGTMGTAGRGGTGGTAGSAAGTTGTAGRGGTTGTAGTTGTGGDTSVTTPLDGQMLLGPCLRDTQAAVCATVSGNCPAANTADPALSGGLTTNKTITLGGDPNTTYAVVLHVQGEVESKNYNGGTDMNATGQSPMLNGWRYPMGTTNPTPSNTNAYNVYMLRVTNPGGTAHQDYMLNSMDGPGTENHTTYGMDYTTPAAGQAGALTVKGTAKIQLVAADSNCSMIKNCGPTQNDGNTCAAPIILQNIETTAKTLNSGFNFTTAYNGQWIVLTVKSVTPM